MLTLTADSSSSRRGILSKGTCCVCAWDARAKKYIFSSEYKTISEILDLFEEVSGVPRPCRRIPANMMLAFSEMTSFYLSRFHPSFPQRFTPGAIRLLRKRLHADNR